MSIYLELIENKTLKQRVELKDHFELGRCNPGEPSHGNPHRMIIAEPQQTTIPRRWFTLNRINENEIRIDNVHGAHSVVLEDHPVPILPGESLSLAIHNPITIILSDAINLKLRVAHDHQPYTPVVIRSLNADRSMLSMTGLSTGGAYNPGVNATVLSMRPLAGRERTLDPTSVVSLLEKALSVVTAAAGSDKFLEAAVRAAVEIVGLDRAVIIGRQSFDKASKKFFATPDVDANQATDPDVAIHQSKENQTAHGNDSIDGSNDASDAYRRLAKNGWYPWVRHVAEQAQDGTPPAVSLSVLSRVDEERKTQICDATRNQSTSSMHMLSSVVAAPILDRNQNLVAILYGDRWLMLQMDQDDITELEALLLDVLASAVAGGLARQAEEKSRAGLSEFFSPRVASMLVQRSDLLAGRDAEVSVLFCDVRGFSSISERFGAQRTIEWINDVLTELSQCVVDRDGVLVDYVGDELFAMWGAPEPQSDHSARAIKTAMDMLYAVDRLRERACENFGCELDVRIGINSGPARVGNVGSRLKFKYGVLGHTVNIGSRLQGACKHLGVRCLAANASIEGLRNNFHTRRLAEISVQGIKETLQVYECVKQADDQWCCFRDEYEAALADFEAGRPGETVHRLGRLLQSFPNDRPSAILLAKAARRLTDPELVADTIWRMDSK